MPNQTLLVLAAGIGSRFGGPKQMAGVGPSGEFIIDYSVYDAVRTGFDRVIFIIRKDIEADFRATIGRRVETQIATDYAFQALDSLPAGFSVPDGRTKPWGTAHAMLCAAGMINEPFAVINADDFYGPRSYEILSRFLSSTTSEPSRHAMVGFALGNTLSDLGHVSRGVCSMTDEGKLQTIEEMTQIVRDGDVIRAGANTLATETLVSMNLWGFKPSLFEHLRRGFRDFLTEHIDAPKAEFYIPTIVHDLISSGEAEVDVLNTPEAWAGVTYREEIDAVRAYLRAQVDAGHYPSPLW